MHEVEQLIAGEWRCGGGEEFVVVDPANGQPVSRAHQASDDDIAIAVKAAHESATAWARVPPAERAAALAAAADGIAADAEQLALLTTREMGRPLREARTAVQAGVATVRQYAELGPLHRGRALAGGVEATDLMVHEPLGVIAVITPWNDPVAVSAGLLAGALVTGNTVVYKPSERTPATGWWLARLFATHLPPGVLSVISGNGRVGANLVSHDLDGVAHVGSTAAGRSIALTCARTGARAVLENGGSDPLVIDVDVSPQWAAGQAALGAFANAGQLCTAVERIYVPESITEPFVAALVAIARAMRQGPGSDDETEIGPLVDHRHRAAVHGQVLAARRAGATLRYGGELPDGRGSFYPPTVLTGCTDDMPLVREETFGPVAPVIAVASFDEGLARAANSPYGLSATVLTATMAHAQRAARELPVGTVKVNDVFGGAPGGAAHPRRASGTRFGYGPELLHELTNTKVVHFGLPS